MNAKRLLALLLAVVMCLCVFAGCKPSVDPTDATEDPTEDTIGTTEGADNIGYDMPLMNYEVYPIDFEGALTAVTNKEKTREATSYALWEKLTGVDLDWQVTAPEKVSELFKSGAEDMPDVFWFVDGLTQAQVFQYGKEGFLVNIMEHLDKMPNLKALYEKDPAIFDAVKDVNGNVYQFPSYVNTLSANTNVLFVRTDITDKAGWETMPTTIEKFLQMCEDVKQQGAVPMNCNTPDDISYNGAYARFFFPAFGSLMEPGLTVSTDGKTVSAGFATTQYKKYISFMRTLYENGYMDSKCFEAERDAAKKKVTTGSVAMNPDATFMTVKNFASGELEMAMLPAMSSQYQGKARWTNYYPYEPAYAMISATCSNMDAAFAIFDALYATEENPLRIDGNGWGVTLWLGEVGKEFSVNKEKGTYSVLKYGTYDSTAEWLAAAGHGSALYLDWPYSEESDTAIQLKTESVRDLYSPVGVDVLSISLLKLTEDEQATYNKSWDAVNQYVEEMNTAFISGEMDIEAEWDNYIATLSSKGLNNIIRVYQAALNRYNAQ